jgi:hypothetical protein
MKRLESFGVEGNKIDEDIIFLCSRLILGGNIMGYLTWVIIAFEANHA